MSFARATPTTPSTEGKRRSRFRWRPSSALADWLLSPPHDNAELSLLGKSRDGKGRLSTPSSSSRGLHGGADSPTAKLLERIEARLAQRLKDDGLVVADDGGVTTVVFNTGSPTNHLAFVPVHEHNATGAKLLDFVQLDGKPSALQQQGKLKLGMQVTHINENSVVDLDFQNCLMLLKWGPQPGRPLVLSFADVTPSAPSLPDTPTASMSAEKAAPRHFRATTTTAAPSPAHAALRHGGIARQLSVAAPQLDRALRSYSTASDAPAPPPRARAYSSSSVASHLLPMAGGSRGSSGGGGSRGSGGGGGGRHSKRESLGPALDAGGSRRGSARSRNGDGGSGGGGEPAFGVHLSVAAVAAAALQLAQASPRKLEGGLLAPPPPQRPAAARVPPPRRSSSKLAATPPAPPKDAAAETSTPPPQQPPLRDTPPPPALPLTARAPPPPPVTLAKQAPPPPPAAHAYSPLRRESDGAAAAARVGGSGGAAADDASEDDALLGRDPYTSDDSSDGGGGSDDEGLYGRGGEGGGVGGGAVGDGGYGRAGGAAQPAPEGEAAAGDHR